MISQQLANKFVPWIATCLWITPIITLAPLGRTQAAGLDFNKRRSHDEKLTRLFNIHIVSPGMVQHIQILIRNLRNRNVLQIHLRPTHQKEQQIERPLEGVKGDPIVFLRWLGAVHASIRACGDTLTHILPKHRTPPPEPLPRYCQ